MRRFRTIAGVFSSQTWQLIAATFLFLIVPIFGFVQLADEVREEETLAYDEAVLLAVNSLELPWLNATTAAATELGGFIGVVVITVGLALLLLWHRGDRKRAVTLGIGVGGAALLNVLLKAYYQRDRPELWERIITENSYSFPSGHAMASSALAISLILLSWPTKWRRWVIASGLIYMVGIAFTRLYLGVHYPTDIIAGWAVSISWVATVVGVIRYRRRVLSWLRLRR